MTDEPADPPSNFSGTITEPLTRMVTTAYDAPGQPGLLLPAYATTATQAVNQCAALRACCSSPNPKGNPTTTCSNSSPFTGYAPPLRNFPPNETLICLRPGPGIASAPAPTYAHTGSRLRIHFTYVSKTPKSWCREQRTEAALPRSFQFD
ncbi:hypothetical protein MRX96_021230 [Rhipicephalus microplus]